MTARVECVECKKSFTRTEVLEGLWSPETLVCSYCYARLQKSPHSISCFGKPTQVDRRGKLIGLGYDSKAEECRSLCPDRKICKRIVLGEKNEDRPERVP